MLHKWYFLLTGILLIPLGALVCLGAIKLDIPNSSWQAGFYTITERFRFFVFGIFLLIVGLVGLSLTFFPEWSAGFSNYIGGWTF